MDPEELYLSEFQMLRDMLHDLLERGYGPQLLLYKHDRDPTLDFSVKRSAWIENYKKIMGLK